MTSGITLPGGLAEPLKGFRSVLGDTLAGGVTAAEHRLPTGITLLRLGFVLLEFRGIERVAVAWLRGSIGAAQAKRTGYT